MTTTLELGDRTLLVGHRPAAAPRTDPSTYQRIRVRPVTPAIGAEVDGVDLRRPLDDASELELRAALADWKVLFFRDQHLTAGQHRDFAARWGELEVHPFLPQGDVPEIVRFEKGDDATGTENLWHSDVSWRQVPSMGSVLRAVEVPAVGGDTLWADMAAAYDGLTDEVKERIDGLRAVHDFSLSFGRAMAPDELARMQEQYPPVEHPVVRTHPETGQRILYVNCIFTSHVVGVEPAESAALLTHLCAQAAIPEYQCRFRWAPGSIAFWDNRSTQHYAASDYWPQRRVMERATIIGEVPA